MNTNKHIGRFAPSPTGRMHLGNVYAALFSWLSVKSKGGEWLLRIEDLDPQRSRKEYALMAEEDLRWLGLEWDLGGTERRGESDISYTQSERGEIYEAHLRLLRDAGLTYPCYCTRADIMATQAPHETDGRIVYAGTCRPDDRGEHRSELRTDRAAATRLIVPDENICFVDQHYGPQQVNLANHCGDFVVRRSDGAWAYQLAVVVDDALMGVTEVVRGCDLLLSCAQQIYLYRLLGYSTPAFGHIPLLCNEAGQRLSKRDKSLDMSVLREKYTPEQLLGLIAYTTGQTDKMEPLSTDELMTIFDWNKLPAENIILGC